MKLIKLASIFIIPAVLIAGCLSLGLSGSAYAYDICQDNNIPADIKASSGCSTSGAQLPEFASVITSIINGVLAVLGLLAVIFIIVGGINYMTSAGDAQKIEKGKRTILYACIGLIICVLSYAVVNFVIKNIIGGEAVQSNSSTSAPADDSTGGSGSSSGSTSGNSSTSNSSNSTNSGSASGSSSNNSNTR